MAKSAARRSVKVQDDDAELSAILQRCLSAPVQFVYAPCPKGSTHAVLVRSNAPEALRSVCDRAAMRGYVARSVTGCNGSKEPPETVVTFILTALGRDAADVQRQVQPMQRVTRLKSSAQLLEEASVRD